MKCSQFETTGSLLLYGKRAPRLNTIALIITKSLFYFDDNDIYKNFIFFYSVLQYFVFCRHFGTIACNGQRKQKGNRKKHAG